MANSKVGFGVAALVIAGAITALLLQQRTLTRLRAENDQLQQQNAQPAPRADEPAARAPADRLSATEQAELLRLRGEVTRLRQQTNELAKATEQNRRARSTPAASAPSFSDPESNPERAMAIAKLNDAKQLMLGFLLYATDNYDQFPTNMDQTTDYLANAKASGSFTGTNQFEQMYAGPLNVITNPAAGIIVREAQATWLNGKWVKAYGFADGHAELHGEADGNFERWERDHTVQIKAR